MLASTAGAAGLLLARQAAAPDPFPIPAEKGFSAEWRRALLERGQPEVARGNELRWIGLPVGGIACGQLYLGGDGRLWLWDLFNQACVTGFDSSAGPHYAKPLEPDAAGPLAFVLTVERRSGSAYLPLGPSSFPEIEFRGTYPIGEVTYRSHTPAVELVLEAFSPCVPLELEDSSLPATLLTFRLRNTGDESLALTLRGALHNPVLGASDPGAGDFVRTTRAVRSDLLVMAVQGADPVPYEEERPDVLFDDFERREWAPWVAQGTAFGAGPVAAAELPAYQGEVGAEGARLAHSHHPRTGEGATAEDVAAGDAHQGTLTSPVFVIGRQWIHCLLGGGAHPEGTGIEVLVDDEVVARASGASENRLRPCALFVGDFEGRPARLRIVDRVSGGWGNVGVDSIVFSDRPGGGPVEARGDYGTLALGALAPPGGGGEGWSESVELVLPSPPPETKLEPPASEHASLARRFELAPGATAEAAFVLAWHFPNPWPDKLGFLPESTRRRRHYAARFADAGEVARHVAREHARLAAATRLWRDTWRDSSLPHWFLERTLASLTTLATSNVYRFEDGRFYATEGVYCCPGTCTHVWQYAQGVARLFPALERDQRERVDFGLAFHPDSGQIDYRAEAARELAVDGQAGTILRVWREHTCSADDAFLRRLWPRVRRALELLLARDPDQDGILDGAQYNTLDTAWHGANAWLSSLYLAAVRAGEAMALELGEGAFAARCRRVLDAGAKALVARLFDGEYFVHRVDPAHPESNSTGVGCHSDQVLGQAWAHQVGLGRILPEAETRSALRALYRYNFAPDVGRYREYMEARIPGGRWFALPGEAGLVLCTWPKGGAEQAAGKGNDAWAAGYFNECMTGFEHQVAAHMLFEGLVEEGLAIERAIHDRYHPSRRNPYNEVECGDHYARALASYGVYLAACGFELHGPKGHLGFAPRLTPASFRAAFTAPEGWGSYAQEIDAERRLTARVELRHGRLRLVTLRVGHAGQAGAGRVRARLGGAELACTHEADATSVLARLAEPLVLAAGQTLVLEAQP